MKIIISENKVESLKRFTQKLINDELDNLRIMSDEEWGMGEMDEIEEVSSVDKIIVDKIDMSGGINVYVNLYINSDREDFDEIIIPMIEYSVEQILPDVTVHVNIINSPL